MLAKQAVQQFPSSARLGLGWSLWSLRFLSPHRELQTGRLFLMKFGYHFRFRLRRFTHCLNLQHSKGEGYGLCEGAQQPNARCALMLLMTVLQQCSRRAGSVLYTAQLFLSPAWGSAFTPPSALCLPSVLLFTSLWAHRAAASFTQALGGFGHVQSCLPGAPAAPNLPAQGRRGAGKDQSFGVSVP